MSTSIARIALRAASRNYISTDSYKKYMKFLGHHIVLTKLLPTLERKRALHVICSVEDFDHIGSQTVRSLRSNGRIARFSCFWAQHEILAHRPLIDIAPINRAYEENLTESRYTLVVVAAAVGSVTQIETMLLHIFSNEARPLYDAIMLVAPFIHKSSISDLRRKLSTSYDGEISWHGYKVHKRLWMDGSPKPGLGKSGAARVGLDDPSAFRRHMPTYIRQLIANRRDPNPDDSSRPPPDLPKPELGTGINYKVLHDAGYFADFSALETLEDYDASPLGILFQSREIDDEDDFPDSDGPDDLDHEPQLDDDAVDHLDHDRESDPEDDVLDERDFGDDDKYGG